MKEWSASIWQYCCICTVCCLQCSSTNCFSKKIINNSLEPLSSWVISQAALEECSKRKIFTDQEVKGVNYDHDYFLLESDIRYFLFLPLRGQQWQHWWLPEPCSSVYTFTFNKTVQLLWQLEVYRVCFKTCAWQFMCINLFHPDMRL